MASGTTKQLVNEKMNKVAHSAFSKQEGREIYKPHAKNKTKPYVNGKEYMDDLLKHIQGLAAGSFIYIADWAMDLNTHLIRDGGLSEDNKLINVLTAAAKNDIQIRILLWKPYLGGMSTDLHDIENEAVLQSILSNTPQFANHIRVIANQPNMTDTHHQKFVLTGNTAKKEMTAFLGGLDLTWGRWDTKEHPVVDTKNIFVGQDYYNPCIYGISDQKIIQQKNHPRMPWHDVHMKIEGPAAKDVERNFVQRWNAHRFDFNYSFPNDLSHVVKYLPQYVPELKAIKNDKTKSNNDLREAVLKYTKYRESESYGYEDGDGNSGVDAEGYYDLRQDELIVTDFTVPPKGKQTVQIIRSMNESTGLKDDKKESSIHEAFVNAIKNAQHYVFIETQYLIGSFSGNAKNDVFQAIVDRILIAHKNEQVFRVYIIFPVHPDGNLEDKTIREFMFWQWQTIHRNTGKTYIDEYEEKQYNYQKLNSDKNNHGGMVGRLIEGGIKFENIKKYLNIFNLRNHGKLNGKPVTEQIYTHTKMMIVDDRIAIIGTANLNDRSLLGNMDSEIAAIVVDQDDETGEMNGNDTWKVRKFAKDLRIKLWCEHLGLKDSDKNKIKDPVIDTTHRLILKIADENTKSFIAAFPGIPSDLYGTISIQLDALASRDKLAKPSEAEKIKGHLVHFPLDWLRDEDEIRNYWYPNSLFS